MKRLIVIIIALVVVALVSNAQAKGESAFYDDMNQMCANTNLNSKTVFITSCYQYIRGFLQGAVITDTVIMEQINSERPVSWGDETGYGKSVDNVQSSDSATLLAGFCLPGDQVSHEVVVRLLEDVKQRFSQADDGVPDNPLAEHLYELLKLRYSCASELA